MWSIMLCLAATCSASDGISGMPRSFVTPQTARCGMAKHSPVPGTTICQGPAASLPLPRFPLVASAPGTVAGVRAVCRDPPLLPLYACPPSGAPSPRGMDNFLAMHSGVYDNTAQCRRDPGAILSRKEHRRVELPQLGPHVFFVKEQTDRGQGWVFRIRLALIDTCGAASSSGIETYRARHFQFRDPSELETGHSLPDSKLAAKLSRLVEAEECAVVPVPGDSATLFHRLPGGPDGGDSYRADTVYSKCQSVEGGVGVTTTEITSVLSLSAWSVDAVISDAEGTVIAKDSLVLDRIA